jgi:5-hydroxyisourate hydrolase-like protein (transthyretin family)
MRVGEKVLCIKDCITLLTFNSEYASHSSEWRARSLIADSFYSIIEVAPSYVTVMGKWHIPVILSYSDYISHFQELNKEES